MTNHALAPPAKQKLLRPGAVADLFGVEQEKVGRDIVAYRKKG